MGMAFLWGYALAGVEAVAIRVEAHVRPGLPGMTVVGLPGAAVREASERIRSGAASAGIPLPTQRITVNLSPVDLRKESPGLDLPVALAVTAAAGYLSPGLLRGVGATGEVALDGGVRPVPGIISMGESARRADLRAFLVPLQGLREASAVEGLAAVGVCDLGEAVQVLKDPRLRDRLVERGRRWLRRTSVLSEGRPDELDLLDAAGHRQAKRALEIAAAGRHHVLLVGSPGAGKTMLARRVPSILPPLTASEALEVTRIWSVAGLTRSSGLIRFRPFRAPHHTASRSALVGGGSMPRPGEVSLAHKGVLFLDELPEFARDCLESLRQPLEEGRVTVSRKSGSFSFPAACTLVAAMNPCPCGWAGHPTRACRCPAAARTRYGAQISGPLLDRIDLRVEVGPLTPEMLESDEGMESSATVRGRVVAARGFRVQREQSSNEPDGDVIRSSRHPARLARRLAVDERGRRLLREGLARQALGGRGYVRTMAVARSIADLDLSPTVTAQHVAEALAFRVAERGYE